MLELTVPSEDFSEKSGFLGVWQSLAPIFPFLVLSFNPSCFRGCSHKADGGTAQEGQVIWSQTLRQHQD